MTKLDFSNINKKSANSFHQQRNQIKKVLRGDNVPCDTCNQPLALLSSTQEEAHIGCKKSCTMINMEID